MCLDERVKRVGLHADIGIRDPKQLPLAEWFELGQLIDLRIMGKRMAGDDDLNRNSGVLEPQATDDLGAGILRGIHGEEDFVVGVIQSKKRFEVPLHVVIEIPEGLENANERVVLIRSPRCLLPSTIKDGKDRKKGQNREGKTQNTNDKKSCHGSSVPENC
jgi:hypothetical protein